ncbi:MAG: hypothetical protein A2096_05870 [Spirochaetes bacterium GWF1_41_5]|nr:MAG: hypothetical protein A2096_05870 [Spirochaetes bacterium GWF1_41_5]
MYFKKSGISIENYPDYCMMCGTKAGGKSDFHEDQIAEKLFFCANCLKIYCSLCTSIKEDGKAYCLRCENELENYPGDDQ